jgi:hypothetical protein
MHGGVALFVDPCGQLLTLTKLGPSVDRTYVQPNGRPDQRIRTATRAQRQLSTVRYSHGSTAERQIRRRRHRGEEITYDINMDNPFTNFIFIG